MSSTSCADCARHVRAREAARAQLELLAAENDRLAAELVAATASAPPASPPAAPAALPAGAAALAAPASPPPPPLNGGGSLPAPDVLCGGDGALPERVVFSVNVAAAAAAAADPAATAPPAPPLAARARALAATLVSSLDGALYVVVAHGDGRLSLWLADPPPPPSSPLCAAAPLPATASSPALWLSQPVPCGGDAAVLAAGHMNGAVSLWAVWRAAGGGAPHLACIDVHAGAHAKFATRVLAAPGAELPAAGARALLLSASSDGTAALWSLERGERRAASEDGDEAGAPAVRVHRLQLLARKRPL